MKKLQNNYTTPEQSKRLLELGVSADSADCYTIINNDVYNKDEIRVRQNEYEINYSFFNNKHYNPCWSVGRLIELYMKARGLDFMYFRIMSDADMIDSIIRMFVENQNEIDFLKLEE